MLICAKMNQLYTRSSWVNVSIMYFLASLAIAGGKKCNGEWAIYACGSGNGRRTELSDLSTAERSESNRESLRDLLNRYARFNGQKEVTRHRVEDFDDVIDGIGPETRDDLRELRNKESYRGKEDVRLQEALRNIRVIKQLLADGRSLEDDRNFDDNEK